MAPLGWDQRTFAHVVALSPLAMRKEHTLAERLVLVWDGELKECAVVYHTLPRSPPLVTGATSRPERTP
jgi:hypothetical protein